MTRRSRGAGSVRYNASRGRYEAVIVVGGIKHTKTVPSPEPNERRKREAEAELAKMVARYGGTIAHRHTVATFMQEWLDFQESRVAYLTWSNHQSRARKHIIPALGKYPLLSLDIRHVDAMMTGMAAAGYSVITIQHVRKTLNAAMNQAEKWQLVPRNLVALTRAPRRNIPERSTLSPDQALAFIKHVQGDRLEALWNLAACLGLRYGEVCGLTWDIIEPPKVRIIQALGKVPGEWELHDPKTRSSRRDIPMPAFIAALLEQRREAQRFEERSIGYSNPLGLIFTSSDGYPLSSQWVRRRLGILLTEAGLPNVTFHDLRHCATSLLLSQGVPVRSVQEILGHASATMTLGTYAHVDDSQRRHAAETLESWRATS